MIPLTQFPVPLGRYELLLRIASGGMATVYLARSKGVAGFERLVAVKLAHPHLSELPEFTSDLVEEAKLAASIHHPNVVPVIDAAQGELGVFLVMEYVEGETLAGLTRALATRGRTLPPALALRIVTDALEGLSAAHSLRDADGRAVGLVHRDFSPQNILVGIDGHSRLADFGVAKAASRTSHTRSGNIKGKLAYMSPEQARGLPLDARSDVWAAGVVAWEALAGEHLYPRRDELALLNDIVNRPARRLRTIRPELPAALDEAIAAALVHDPEARCSSASEFRARLVDGAAELGGIAEPAAIAEVVGEIATPTLRERRARVLTIGAADQPSHGSGAPTPAMAAGGATPDADGGSSVPHVAKHRVRWSTALLAAGAIGGGAWIVAKASPTEPGGDALVLSASAVPSEQSEAPVPEAGANDLVMITLKAPLAIRSVRIGTQVIEVQQPAPVLAIQVHASEHASGATVEATVIDGRIASGSLAPDTQRVDLVLPSGSAAPAAPRVAPGAPGKKAPKRPLKGNPYEGESR